MSGLKIRSLAVNILRWTARVWSLLLLLAAVLEIILPDPYAVSPVPLMDWIALGFWGLSILGLLLAWRWEALGGLIAIAGLLGHYVIFRISRGVWFPNATLPILIFGLPGLIFLVCRGLSRGTKKSTNQEAQR